MKKILVVEDEALLRESYKLILSTEPYIIAVASDGKQALDMCMQMRYDLILLDLMMPKLDGTMFLEKAIDEQIDLPKVIVLSNLSSGDEIAKALMLGAYKNVVKADLSPRQLLSLVRYELQSV